MSKSIRYVGWTEFSYLVHCLGEKIRDSNKEYDVIYGIPRGGLIPSVMLSHVLETPIIHSIKSKFERRFNKILVLDDIVDSGKTLSECYDQYDTATVFLKRSCQIIPTYYIEEGLIPDDEWIMFPWEVTTHDPISKVNL